MDNNISDSALDSSATTIPPPFASDEEFNELISEENLVGEGVSRNVYSYDDPVLGKVVIKVAKERLYVPTEGEEHKVNMLATNLKEIIAYLHYTASREELGQIFSWSNSGRYLVMEFLEPLKDPADRNDLFENGTAREWLTDVKPDNAGLAADGKVKWLDYATIKELTDSKHQSFI